MSVDKGEMPLNEQKLTKGSQQPFAAILGALYRIMRILYYPVST